MRYCTNCGNVLAYDALFCCVCGAKAISSGIPDNCEIEPHSHELLLYTAEHATFHTTHANSDGTLEITNSRVIYTPMSPFTITFGKFYIPMDRISSSWRIKMLGLFNNYVVINDKFGKRFEFGFSADSRNDTDRIVMLINAHRK